MTLITGEAGIMDEQADTVRIMSIHKSKVLNFLYALWQVLESFNKQDVNASMLFSVDYGIALMQ